jgi:glyoxylase-like metal-dependent hydrolase (beta-lactamase superfamily II)
MTRIFEDLYYYRNPLNANCVVFVFKEGSSLDFIDTGIARLGLMRRVWQDMHKDGLDPRNIRRIYHCHYHFDHVQSDVFFQQRAVKHNGDVKVYVPRPDLYRTSPNYRLFDINYFELQRHFPETPPDFLLQMLYPLRYLMEPLLHAKTPENIQILDHNQKIELGKRTGIVYTTGGHTEGHSFIHINDADNILVSSDHDALNEFVCNWGKTLEAVRLAEKIHPDNVLVGHNPPKIGPEKAMGFISSYMTQFDKVFGPVVKLFRLNQTVNLTRIARKMMGYIHHIKPAFMWAHMSLYAICKYFEEVRLGKMRIISPGELVFEILEDPEKIDLLQLIKTGKISN